MRYVHFDYFRAIAIITIILGHSFNHWERSSFAEQILANALTGGTALFVFISGFFFHAVFAKRFDYSSFIKKKFTNVALPYLLLSIAYMGVFLVLRGNIAFPLELSADPQLQNPYAFAANVITGVSLIGYWYVPFAMLLFILSPVFLRYLNLSTANQLLLLVTLFMVSSYVHRPAMGINPVHSLLYFTPFYLLGMIYSQHRESIEEWLSGKTIHLGGIWLGILVLMTSLGQTGNMEKFTPWTWNGIDLMVFQKIAMIIFTISVLKHHVPQGVRSLILIANLSFALFFLHPWVLAAFSFTGLQDRLTGFIGFLTLAASAVLISLIATLLTKKLFRDKSRLIIGY